MLLIFKLLSLVFMASCFYLGPRTSSASSAPSVFVSMLVAAGILALLFWRLESFAPPWLNEVFTALALLAFCMMLLGPVFLVLLPVLARMEKARDARIQEALIARLTVPGQTRELARYLRGADDMPLLGEVSRWDAERIEQALLPLPPEQLRESQVAESLLLGIRLETDPNWNVSSPEELCRLYVKVRERSGFCPAQAPFSLRYQDRAVSRIAELGFDPWREEIGRESKAFQDVVHRHFSEKQLHMRVPQPLAPGESLVSRSLGSLPLHAVLSLNRDYLPRPPGLEEPSSTPDHDAYRRLTIYQETRDALAAMKAWGVDFTEEELCDPGLQAFLETLRTAPPPPP